MQDSVAHIFIVDDDESIRQIICTILQNHKYQCTCFSDANECVKKLNEENQDYSHGCDLLISDLKMPGKDGIELLDEVRASMPWLPIIIMSAYGDIPMSVKAVLHVFSYVSLDRPGINILVHIFHKQISF